MIDLANLDLKKFHSKFGETLRNLFSKYLDIDGILADSSIAGASTSEPLSRREMSKFRREQSRLQLQRLKSVKLEVIQRYQKARLNRGREQRKMLSIPVETSEEIEAKKIALIKQERRNERERVRRWRLHQQNLGRQKINDITQAINCIQEQLPVEISIEEKCKIYAVLSDLNSKRNSRCRI